MSSSSGGGRRGRGPSPGARPADAHDDTDEDFDVVVHTPTGPDTAAPSPSPSPPPTGTTGPAAAALAALFEPPDHTTTAPQQPPPPPRQLSSREATEAAWAFLETPLSPSTVADTPDADADAAAEAPAAAAPVRVGDIPGYRSFRRKMSSSSLGASLHRRRLSSSSHNGDGGEQDGLAVVDGAGSIPESSGGGGGHQRRASGRVRGRDSGQLQPVASLGEDEAEQQEAEGKAPQEEPPPARSRGSSVSVSSASAASSVITYPLPRPSHISTSGAAIAPGPFIHRTHSQTLLTTTARSPLRPPRAPASTRHHHQQTAGALSTYELYKPGGAAVELSAITPSRADMAELKARTQKHLSLYRASSSSSTTTASGHGGGGGGGDGRGTRGGAGSRSPYQYPFMGRASGKGEALRRRGQEREQQGRRRSGSSADSGGGKDLGRGMSSKSNDPNEPTSTFSRKKGILHPFGWKRKTWDMLILVILLYIAFVTPYRVSFDMSDGMGPFFLMDRLVDVLFIVDLVLNFFTGWVTKDGAVILQRRVIVQKYLRSWFLVDLISSIPFDLIYVIVHASGSAKWDTLRFLEALRMARVYKLFRLLRVFRFVGLFTRLQGGFFLTHMSSNILKFALTSVFAMHWAACCFLAVDRRCPTGYSWIEAVGLAHSGAADVYIASLYWSFATFLTIGYGDISARCTTTRVFSMVVMLFGCSLYAYALNYFLTYLNQSILRASNIIGDRMDAVNSFAHYRQLPPKLRATIHEYFQKVNASFRSKEDLQNERDVLALMAPWLRDDVITTINRGIVRSVPIFDRIVRSAHHTGGGEELLQHLVDIMCAKVFRPDEFIMKEGETSDRIYVLAKGRAEVVKFGKIKVAVLETGAFFGEAGFLWDPTHGRGAEQDQPQLLLQQRPRRWASVYSNTYCDVRYISRAKFEEVLQLCPDVSATEIRHMMLERYQEVLRDQAELESLCMSEYPQAKEAYEQEVLKEMLEDELLAMVGDPHDADPPDADAVTPTDFHHHDHHHPLATTPVPQLPPSAGASAPDSPTSTDGSDRARGGGGGLSAHSSLASMAGLVVPPTVDEPAGGGFATAASQRASGVFAPPGPVEQGENVYDAGVWRSATARKERRRYARSLSAHKHTLSSAMVGGGGGSSSAHRGGRLLKGHGHGHRRKQQHGHQGAQGGGAGGGDDGGFHI